MSEKPDMSPDREGRVPGASSPTSPSSATSSRGAAASSLEAGAMEQGKLPGQGSTVRQPGDANPAKGHPFPADPLRRPAAGAPGAASAPAGRGGARTAGSASTGQIVDPVDKFLASRRAASQVVPAASRTGAAADSPVQPSGSAVQSAASAGQASGRKGARSAGNTEADGVHVNDDGVVDTTGRKVAQITPLRMAAPAGGGLQGNNVQSLSRGGDFETPQHIIRQGLLVVLLFFGCLGLWAYFGEISGAVVAPGRIKVESERKTVQHLEGGIVDRILVREGEDVVEGQVLVELDSVQADASENALNKQLVAQWAASVRALAEKSLADSLVWPDELVRLAGERDSLDVLENERKIFLARREAMQGQISLLESQLAQLKAQISGFEDQLRAETAIIGTLNEELGAKRQLYRERYLEKSQILELERVLAGHKGERGRLRQAIAETKQRDAELRLRMDDVRNRFVEEATSQAGQLENDILQTRERLRPLKDTKARLQIKAPVSGKVVDLKVHSKGGVIRPGEPLMDIVPYDTPLIAETQVPPNKITEVYTGQDALVQMDAFDTRVIPHVPAKVTYVSADLLETRTPSGDTTYYLCHVVIDPSALKEADLYLSPGMPVTVYITTKKRTVLYYMFEPLIKNWERALRE